MAAIEARYDFFEVHDDAPLGTPPEALDVEPAPVVQLPAISEAARNILRAEAGEVAFVGKKPVTRVLYPEFASTMSIKAAGQEVPHDVVVLAHTRKRPKHNG